ncbi:hypothetical protein ACJDU8_22970 [Clostridium sp. WILCCON 0269]|uniref:Uncharacterized protein n=1 Tax=Candidatus Clostridium eludens TaxID=3381663 RepID=A0ABW8SR40_9CLOT
MGKKLRIIKNAKPIKFGKQVSIFDIRFLKSLEGYQLRMMIDELDTGTIRAISKKERTESRKGKSKKSEI